MSVKEEIDEIVIRLQKVSDELGLNKKIESRDVRDLARLFASEEELEELFVEMLRDEVKLREIHRKHFGSFIYSNGYYDNYKPDNLDEMFDPKRLDFDRFSKQTHQWKRKEPDSLAVKEYVLKEINNNVKETK